MHSRAIEQAEIRLDRVRASTETLCLAKSYKELEIAWIDFLSASSTIYSKLEQGAKGFGKSEAWFGRKKNERRTDELLRYNHHARNSEEHGIDEVIKRWDSHQYVAPDGMILGLNVPSGESIADLHFVGTNGERIEAKANTSSLLRLVEVQAIVYLTKEGLIRNATGTGRHFCN